MLLFKNLTNKKYFLKNFDNLTLSEVKALSAIYPSLENKLRNKFKRKKVMKIGFLVSVPAMFSAKPLLDACLKDKYFEPTLIILPDFRFGFENAVQIQNECYLEFEQYKENIVVIPIDKKKDKKSITDLADIIVFNFSYDISHKKYSLKKFIQKGILPVIINYGFFRSIYDRETLVSSPVYSLFWKAFIETKYNSEEFQNYAMLKGSNTVLTGYCKMDDYKTDVLYKSWKKTLIIAPHHSVIGGHNDTLGLSNFMMYSDLFLQLPDMYQEIHFIFRPHPVLFFLLSKQSFWGRDKVLKYIETMAKKNNVTYRTNFDYLNDFAISDGIIQDCGSYLVEYFYTNKPQCYMLKSPKDIDAKFTLIGKKCLDYCYIAYNKNQIIDFIDDVIIKGLDSKRSERKVFAKENIMINYPNVSNKILDYFKSTFCI